MEAPAYPNHTVPLAGPPNHSNRLPSELKCAVASYLSNMHDRKSLSLVNKAWSDVILPVIWETFDADLIASGARKVDGLASANSNIIKHVRKIKLSSHTSENTAEDQLLMLLATIPRGQLRVFEGCSVPTSTLKLMLRMHTEMEELKVPHSNLSELLQSPWTMGCFSNLTTLGIYVEASTRDGIHRVWTECTGLRHLRLRPIPNNGLTELPDELFSSGVKSIDATMKSLEPHVVPMKLISVHIFRMTLPHTADAMLHRIDFLALQELTISKCASSSTLLGALAIKIGTGRSRLRKLRMIRLDEESRDDFIQSMALLLLAFQGLEQLHIHCQNCAKIAVQGILNHGETLKDLVIVNGSIYREDKDRSMSAADMQQIAAACPRLEHLCLNLYEIDPDKPEGDVLGPHPSISFEPTEFERALSAIAILPSLQTLRLTNPPNYRHAYDTDNDDNDDNENRLFNWFPRTLERGDQRHAFQARADGIMRYLGHRGSHIKPFVFAPTEKLVKVGSADKNGHVWPNYFYCRGKRTDHKMAETAIAIPITDWKMEFGNVESFAGL